MIRLLRQRSAMTLLEVVFVIVILGIVTSIGSKIIANVYESYVVERALYRATTKTELAINQIANRLRYAIPGTVIARPSIDSTTTKPITSPIGPTDKVLQWVGYDGDSFEAIGSSANTGTARRPGWSGVCDINASSGTTIKTPGSHLELTDTIIKNLGNSHGIRDAVLFFPGGKEYNVSSGTGETITLDTSLASGDVIYERYMLAWSSYALEVDGNGDLILHYNFPAHKGQAISGDQSSVLLHHVTNFRFKGSPGSIRIKICKNEQIGSTADANVTACKEKVIF